jgi:hypothetical protein
VLAVALAATDTRPRTFLDEQVRAVGAGCVSPRTTASSRSRTSRTTGRSILRSTRRRRWRSSAPWCQESVPVAYGAPRSDEMLSSAVQVEGVWNDGRFMCGGDFNVLHRAQAGGDVGQRAPVHRARQGRQGKCGKFTVDDEPKGFAEVTADRHERARDTAGGWLWTGVARAAVRPRDHVPLRSPASSRRRSARSRPRRPTSSSQAHASSRTAMTFRWANAKAGDSAVKDASLIGPSNPNAAVQRIFSFFGPAEPADAGRAERRARPRHPVARRMAKQGAVRVTRPGFQVWELAR